MNHQRGILFACFLVILANREAIAQTPDPSARRIVRAHVIGVPAPSAEMMKPGDVNSVDPSQSAEVIKRAIPPQYRPIEEVLVIKDITTTMASPNSATGPIALFVIVAVMLTLVI